MKFSRIFAGVCIGSLVVACGGGGSDLNINANQNSTSTDNSISGGGGSSNPGASDTITGSATDFLVWMTEAVGVRL